jgi:two-component system sensor histidine kinase AlgZ
VRIERRGGRILARVENPYFPEHQHRAGNRMAQANIRERLQLFFDAEASLEAGVHGDRYVVQVELPYRSREAWHA